MLKVVMPISYKDLRKMPFTHVCYVPIQQACIPASAADNNSAKSLTICNYDRNEESTAGRLCAQVACEKLGEQEVTIGQYEDGRPHFPSGIVGSISHSHAYAFSVVGKESDWYSLGIDVEKMERTPRQLEAIHKKILTEEERKKWGGDPQASLAIFTLKEAAYKCVNWIWPCLITSFEVSEMTVNHVEIHLRNKKDMPTLQLIAHTELDMSLHHHVSVVALQANYALNRASK